MTATRHALERATPRDLRVMAAQLGRPMRGVVGIAARCVCGKPTVVATAPRLPDGSPFPTFYYLTHPAATAAVSRLEGSGVMAELTERVQSDEALREQLEAAHAAYLADRRAFGDPQEIATVSAGGMPTRVKCLHAMLAHTLAVGGGVNPIGDWVLRECGWSPQRCECEPQAADPMGSNSTETEQL